MFNLKFLKNKNKSGIALIMTLSILCVLIVLVTAFVFSAKTELTAADIYESNARAQQLTDDHFSAFMSSMWDSHMVRPSEGDNIGRYYKGRSSSDTTNWSSLYDYSTNEGNRYISFNDDRDGESVTYGFGFRATPKPRYIRKNSIRAGNKREFAWWPIYSFELNNELDEDISPPPVGGNGYQEMYAKATNIVGRAFWMLIDEGVKFDLNSYLEIQEKKLLGFDQYDLKVLLNKYNMTDSQIINKLQDNRPMSSDGVKRPWDSWESIWRAKVFSSDPEYPNENEEEKATNTYFATNVNSIKKGNYYSVMLYPGDVNNGNEKAWFKREFFHKFYLGLLAKSTNKIPLDDLLQESGYSNKANFFRVENFGGVANAAKVANDIEYKNMDKISGVYVNETTRFIPWLHMIKGHLYNDKEYNKRIRLQVAANLLDYSDSDNTATTDYQGDFKRFNFCGLEKAPYITNVGTRLTFVQKHPLDGTPSNKYDGKIKLYVTLVNFYNEGMTSTVSAKIELDAEQGTIIEGSGEVKIAANSIETIEIDCNAVFEDIAELNATKTTILKNPKLNIALKVEKGGALVDVSVLRKMGVTISNPSTALAYFTYMKFRDPRINNFFTTDETEWEKAKIMAMNGVLVDKSEKTIFVSSSSDEWRESLGEEQDKEIIKTFEAGRHDGYSKIAKDFTNEKDLIDNEPDANNYKLSTAVIRNQQMTSLWELGVIHRGEPWRTLNLKKCVKRHEGLSSNTYVLPQTEYFNGGKSNERYWEHRRVGENVGTRIFRFSGVYEDGDAAILEQVKTTKEAFRRPLINPFNPDPRFWNFIFDSIGPSKDSFPIKADSTFVGSASGTKLYIIPSKMSESELKNAFVGISTSHDNAEDVFRNGNKGTHIQKKVHSVQNWAQEIPKDENKADIYQEEIIGKVAEELNYEYAFFRMIATIQTLNVLTPTQSLLIQRLYDMDKKDPRVINYIKMEVVENNQRVDQWFKIIGEQKMSAIIQHNVDSHEFNILEKSIKESRRN